jgi:hypothetical protein
MHKDLPDALTVAGSRPVIEIMDGLPLVLARIPQK